MASNDDDRGAGTPAQHHESTAASRDRAYHILRGEGVPRDAARKIADEAVDKAKRSRGA